MGFSDLPLFVPPTPPLNVSGAAPAPANTTLSDTFTDSADPVLGGANFSYAATIKNTGAHDANNVTVTITLDASVVFVSMVGVNWVLSRVGQIITATTATILAGATFDTITVTVTAPNANANVASALNAFADNAPGINDSQPTAIAVINRDGPQNVMVPLTFNEHKLWPLGVPSFVIFTDGVSGPFTDLVQASAPSFATVGTGLGFAQAFAAWVLKFFTTTDAAAGAGAGGDMQTLFNFDTQNVSIFTFFGLTSAASRRCLFALNDNEERIDVLSNGRFSLTRNNLNGVIDYRNNLIHPLWIDWQPPADNLGHGPGLFDVGTDKEIIHGTASLPTGSGMVGPGAAGTAGENSPTAQFGPWWIFIGSKADTQQAVTQKNRLISTGWAVAY